LNRFSGEVSLELFYYLSKSTYVSCDEVRRTPSRLIYSVFLSHGTCVIDALDPLRFPAFVAIPAELDMSDKRNASFGSNFGNFDGSGFNAKAPPPKHEGQLHESSKFTLT